MGLPERALQAFCWVQKQPHLFPDGRVLASTVELAWKLLSAAEAAKRMLDPSIYVELILELGRNPDKYLLVMTLLDELGQREELNLSQQDCTAIMKVGVRLHKFDVVESLFHWFRQSGIDPSVASNCLFDLLAYRVVIKLFVALNDLLRACKEVCKEAELAGFKLDEQMVSLVLAN
ncbi:hypothetical protein Pint_20622 [Pistacia integerrima]|uniref:Uncharacterized protein n=1 Tax=Pistacia integerrima TaxID=434235 RepID=A0ACC0XBQ4_9ROSI|nr:hypothetical protein Pint_20622 [Pistacia integerrima]